MSAISRRRTAATRMAQVRAATAIRKSAEGFNNTGRPSIRAKFDAAQTSDDNRKHWANADYLGPNAEASPQVRRIVRARARYEVANNTYAKGMIDTLALDTVGTGPMLQLRSRAGQKANTRVEELFWDWFQATKGPAKMLGARKAKAKDGEWFASFFTNPALRTTVKFDWQPHESEMISGRMVNVEFDPGDGILVDDFGNIVGYRLLREHPGEGMFTATDGEADVIPASQMIHLFNQDRPNQLRGISEITPALPLYAQLRRFTLAVLQAAENAADISWIIKSQLNATEVQAIKDMDPIPFFKGMGLTLPAGWEMQQFDAKQPQTTYEMFKRAILAEIARCLCMPYNVAAGDSSKFNYSSARLDSRNYAKAIRVERSLIEADVLDRLFAEWWKEARLIEGYLPGRLRRLVEPPAHEWRWDGEEYIDPQKEANANATKLSSLMTTHKDLFASMGKDWAVEFQQKSDELKRAAELGIPPEMLGIKPANQPLDPGEEDDDEDEDIPGGDVENESKQRASA